MGASNLPPGVSGGRYAIGVYVAVCPTCGTTNVAEGYCELGGLFLENDIVACEHDVVHDQVWEQQEGLAQCDTCDGLARLSGSEPLMIDGEEFAVRLTFVCDDGHATVKEYA